MRRIITTLATLLITTSIFAGTMKFKVPNAGKFGKDCMAICDISNQLDKTKEFYMTNWSEYVDGFKERYNVTGYRTVNKEYIMENYGEGVWRLAKDYVRFNLYKPDNTGFWVIRKIAQNLDKEDTWLVITIVK